MPQDPDGRTPTTRIPPREAPVQCPRCGHARTEWMTYRNIPDAPAAGCIHCGVVLYFTEPPQELYFFGRRKLKEAVV